MRYELDDVCVRYGAQLALDRVSLRIAQGESVGVIGPSGAGKTTLLNLLVGAVRPQAGRLRVLGRDLEQLGSRGLRELRADTGTVHQDLRLVPTQRVLSNVLCGRLGRWPLLRSLRELLWPRRLEVERVYALLERVGIPEKLFERVEDLSGGQQRRVAIARALYQEPEALLADEPLSGVDPARAGDLLQLLRAIALDRGLTFCASLHDVALAREFFPRLVGLRGGRVLFDGPSAQVSDADLAQLYALEPGDSPPC